MFKMGSFKVKKASGISLLATVIILVSEVCLLWTLPDKPGGETCEMSCLQLLCRSNSANGLKQCCDGNSVSLTCYLKMAVTIKYEAIKKQEAEEAEASYKEPSIQMKTFLKNTRWTIKPTARITGTSQPKPRIYDRGMIPIRAWRLGQRSFKRYGMRYRNGRLIVPIGGTYNIYSYLDLFETCIADNLNSTAPVGFITHDMVRFNIVNGNEEVLLSKVRSHEIPQNKHFNIYDSYLSGTVVLEAGDEVFVRVSNLSYIHSTSSNYFGVYMI